MRARGFVAWGAALTLAAMVLMVTPRAEAQTGVLVVQMPFTGSASDNLLHDVEDGVRAALLARGLQGPDRPTVRAAMGVAAPTDTAGIVAFARNMGGTHVLTGTVTPLTGQYNVELRLFEVATLHMATQQRNVGDGEEGTAFPELLNALFAPGAMQPSPEEQARAADERRRAEEARQADERRRQDEARRAEQARIDEERRRRAEADRNRRVYRYAEGGPISLGAAYEFGGRVTSVAQRPGAPSASGVATGLRLEGGYAVLPDAGIEVGGAVLLLGLPTAGLGIGVSGRWSYPAHGFIPVRGSAGAVLGLYQGISGAQSTTVWTSLDARVEYDPVPQVTLFGGLVFDGIPGLFGSLGVMLGARFHFGGDAAPAATPSSAPPSSAANADPAP